MGWWTRWRRSVGWTTRAEDIEALAAAMRARGGFHYRYGAADESLAVAAHARRARREAAIRAAHAAYDRDGDEWN